MLPTESRTSGDSVEQVLRAHPWIAAAERDDTGLTLWPDPALLAVRPTPGGLVTEFLEHWTEVYDWTYAQGSARLAADLDLSGWRATDTGESFPTAHMAEWVARTVELVLRARPRRMLEVGTGTGMLTHRLVPHLDGYVGCDPSEVAVTTVGSALPDVTLMRAAAHEIHTPRLRAALRTLGGPPDCVLLNSVTQCFPDVAYLAAVLDEAITLVAPGGTVVIGDVRHAGLLHEYCRWAQRCADPAADEAELDRRAAERAEREEELLVEPATLATLAAASAREVRIAVHAKTMRADTELTRYRFDAVLHVDPPTAVTPRQLSWGQLAGPDRLQALCHEITASAVWVQAVPNRLRGAPLGTEGGTPRGVTPHELYEALAGADAVVLLDPHDPTQLQVVAPVAAAPVPVQALSGPLRAHEPLPRFARRRITEMARRTLRDTVPSAARLPLTVALPIHGDLQRHAESAGRAAISEVDLDALPGAMRSLDLVSLHAMAAMLRDFGGLPDPGVSRAAEQIAEAMGVAHRHRWILWRWLQVLTEEQVLVCEQGGRYRLGSWPDPDACAAADAALDSGRAALGYPDELTRFFRAAIEHLPQLLRDQVALQALLFPDGEITTALGTYQDNTINRYLNAALAEVLRRAAGPRPRVLELGAGVGGTTAATLTALADRKVDYLFTDVSRFFLDAARERFGTWRAVRYALVDINTELPGQGVPEAGTDVLVAANVAHNAHHVGQMLEGLRRLLAPGGLLLLVESCREHYQALTSMHFLMSPRPGQPAAGLTDIRAGTDRIFLTREEWLGELARAGLRLVLDLPHPDSPLAALAQHLFVATPLLPGRRN